MQSDQRRVWRILSSTVPVYVVVGIKYQWREQGYEWEAMNLILIGYLHGHEVESSRGSHVWEAVTLRVPREKCGVRNDVMTGTRPRWVGCHDDWRVSLLEYVLQVHPSRP